ncbi:pentatricopeptide repeat (PPR-like) superfamily protein [Striga asiatica]|uniref:Pentatricopeptide repeat (PPR-like) superfamily protein n=1 Tax=Striga asiatica TaxID=4170 RepID=A0A5A7R4L3_STRAF|nr:pentatricopeptide repeat (PPR-like) superfamily protein [Striga asiatica]
MENVWKSGNQFFAIGVGGVNMENGHTTLFISSNKSEGWIEMYVLEEQFEYNSHIVSTLINMHGKCGNLKSAPQLLIMGMHIIRSSYFNACWMRKKVLCLDDITFVGVLFACVHAGLMSEGHRFFNTMNYPLDWTSRAGA